MLFSSLVFLQFFLPLVLLLYYGVFRHNRKLQNIFLFIASIGFYAWGEPRFALILMVSILVNWYIAKLIDKNRSKKKLSLTLLIIDFFFNLSLIFVFKYLAFTISTANSVLGQAFTIPKIALPIGISFFTFQALSYVVDVYRNDGRVQKSPLNVGLYIAFFPQLIAGPIVRYNTIDEQIDNRKESFDEFSKGVARFIMGLAKKVLLANSFAIIANPHFKYIATLDISIEKAWIGAIAYTFQIYFDFSGYSDMAIGLGKMFGFKFEENFNYPYIAKSTSEFWRRWHISLGRWFRDYVYIPLGGNRCKNKYRVIFNLFVVWLLTGIWHGANYTFIVWGLMYFVTISLEKTVNFEKIKGFTALKYIYTMLLVVIGWVIFKSDSLTNAIIYLKCMFGFSSANFELGYLLFILKENFVIIVTAMLISTPIYQKLKNWKYKDTITIKTAYVISVCLLFLLSVSTLVKGSYNPFIYFNF